jgi:hypothetical protein
MFQDLISFLRPVKHVQLATDVLPPGSFIYIFPMSHGPRDGED